ncbi:MAG: IS1595 family transposase [Clostridia bacterium]|nr:IS1595 family transposase [Clostridia bacterium]
MDRVSFLVNQVAHYSSDELQVLSEKILALLQSSQENVMPPIKHSTVCQRCGSKRISKYGKDRKGHQRYKCSGCATTFIETSYTPIAYSHYDLNRWKKYISMMLSGASIQKSAEACGISYRTAFIWRHKILNALQKDQNGRTLGGIVEVDDLFMSINYKGNHTKSKRFCMPRPAYKRGTDNRSSSGGKACVMCAVERNGQTYAEVLGKGNATESQLAYAFADRIVQDSIVLTDKAHTFKRFFETLNVENIRLASHTNPRSMISPPEVRGALHIQNVNNLHARFRRFLRPYNGVATKYLNHYIGLFVWLENHKKISGFNAERDLFFDLFKEPNYVRSKDIFALQPIPQAA